MKRQTYNLDGHTIEFRTGSTGSASPWGLDFAESIGLSLMVTSDIRDFILVDGESVYAFDSVGESINLAQSIYIEYDGKLRTWEDFKQVLKNLEQSHKVRYFGSLSETKKQYKLSKKKDILWGMYPKDERYKMYVYVKNLSEEERKKWYDEKFREFGL